jgi:xylulokinase
MSRSVAVCLPHDWLTWKLAGGGAGAGGGAAGGAGAGLAGVGLAGVGLEGLRTDRGDASGTGYWSGRTGEYRSDLLRRAAGRELAVPVVLGPASAAGELAAFRGFPAPGGAVLGPGTGDNAAAAFGLHAGPGDVVISIGTSGTVFAVSETATSDASGIIAGFADATGRFLPLVCTLNAARVLVATASMLNVDLDQLAELALAAEPGAGGLTLLPYLEGERTPNRPDATGTLAGLTGENATAQNLARAAIEGMACGLADGLDAIKAAGVPVSRVLLIGGGARSEAVRQIAPTVFGVAVEVPPAGEYVADGAARQAAWVLSGCDSPPVWKLGETRRYEADPVPVIRERYAAVRDA